jgi:hypothetical protein
MGNTKRIHLFYSEIQKERCPWGYVNVDWRQILKRILKKEGCGLHSDDTKKSLPSFFVIVLCRSWVVGWFVTDHSVTSGVVENQLNVLRTRKQSIAVW